MLRLTWQALAWLPAVLVLSGLTRLLHGVRPRLASLGWLGLGYAVVVLRVRPRCCSSPTGCSDLSPFEHLALVPAEDFDPAAVRGASSASPRCWGSRAGWPSPGATSASVRCHVGAGAGLASAARRHRDVDRGRLAGGPGRPARGRQAARAPGRARPRRARPTRRHFAYWRREADVAHDRASSATPTACGRPRPRSRRTPRASRSPGSGSRTPPAAGCSSRMALGRFAGADLAARPRFLARHQLRDRLARVERRGGWPTLARTTVADVADHLWRRRESMLDRVDALPQVPQHGDPAPGEPARPRAATTSSPSTGRCSGVGPVGGDLGYYSLAAREEFEPLLEAYLMGLPDGLATARRCSLGARVTAVYTALSRAEWALARVGRRRGRAGREVPPPRRRARTCGRCSGSSRRSRRCSRGEPAGSSLRAGRPRTCRRPRACPARSRS